MKKCHAELLDLFRREIDFRRELRDRVDGGLACSNEEIDYYEHLYWCGLLLYLIGDPADVPLMWEAKHIDMDTGCGFDGQFMVGAGVDATLTYLNAHGHKEVADYLVSMRNCGDFGDLPGWESSG